MSPRTAPASQRDRKRCRAGCGRSLQRRKGKAPDPAVTWTTYANGQIHFGEPQSAVRTCRDGPRRRGPEAAQFFNSRNYVADDDAADATASGEPQRTIRPQRHVINPDAEGSGNSVITPAVVMRPIPLPAFEPSANHSAPSGPVVMLPGELPLAIENCVITPAVVMRPIWWPLASVNHKLPSGPAAMPVGWLPAVGIGNSVITPAVVMRPIWSP